MQILSQCEINTINGGSFLGDLPGIIINLAKKLIPGKKLPYTISSDVEKGSFTQFNRVV